MKLNETPVLLVVYGLPEQDIYAKVRAKNIEDLEGVFDIQDAMAKNMPDLFNDAVALASRRKFWNIIFLHHTQGVTPNFLYRMNAIERENQHAMITIKNSGLIRAVLVNVEKVRGYGRFKFYGSGPEDLVEWLYQKTVSDGYSWVQFVESDLIYDLNIRDVLNEQELSERQPQRRKKRKKLSRSKDRDTTAAAKNKEELSVSDSNAGTGPE